MIAPPRLNLRTKALFPVVLIVLMSLVYSGFSLYALLQQADTRDALAGRFHEVGALNDVAFAVEEIAHPLTAYVTVHDHTAPATVERMLTDLERRLDTLASLALMSEEEREIIGYTRQVLVEIRRLTHQIFTLPPREHNQQMHLLNQLSAEQLHPLHDRFRGWLRDESRQVEALRAASQSQFRQLLLHSGILITLGTGLLGFAFWYYERALVRPLLTLNDAVRVFAAGNLKHQIPAAANDEIGALTRNINRMAAALDAQTTRLSKAAETDALTGLLNRRAFEALIGHELSGTQAHDGVCALALFDLDHFKVVNDTHGHAAGDAVLQRIATLSQQVLRMGDHCFRYGGEEFILLLPHTTFANARATLERFRNTIEQTAIPYEDKTLRVTISYGLAFCPQDGSTREALVQHADDALYAAKQGGRNRGVWYGELGRG